MKFVIAAVCLLALVGCGMGNQSYTIDGVPVVLEDGTGANPVKEHLTLAVQLFRRDARDHWELDDADDASIWRSLREIRWTQEAVIDGARYDESLRNVEANWKGCALEVPLYPALGAHYVWELTNAAPSEAELDWAAEVQLEAGPVVCTGDQGASFWDQIGL